MDNLYLLKSSESISDSFFKFTIHGMRYACKMRGLEYTEFALPEIKVPKKLPVVLNGSEVKAMFKACNSLKQRPLIGFCYDCGLRSSEVQYLQVSHVDLERRMLHVHQGKGSKDRCVPLGKLLCRGMEQYLVEEVPYKYMFSSRGREPYTDVGILSMVKSVAKKAGVIKDICTHTLSNHNFYLIRTFVIKYLYIIQ